MAKFETKKGTFTYCGYKYESERLSFRMASLEEVIRISSDWMKERFGKMFIGFEFRTDFQDMYLARMKDGLSDDTHLNDKCVIFSTGKQWKALLYHDKTIGYHAGV